MGTEGVGKDPGRALPLSAAPQAARPGAIFSGQAPPAPAWRRLAGPAALVAGLWIMLVLSGVRALTPAPVQPLVSSINPYHLQVLMYVGINIILTASLNLVNGFMGEFSVGHAAFMAAGAYACSIVMVWWVPRPLWPLLFPLAVVAGGAVASLVALLVAIPSFRTRGDYLAIVTLALNMIVKSAIENIEAIGGPRGFLGMGRLTQPAWVYAWVVLTLWVLSRFVYSRFGRGANAIREDEVASEIVGVDTRRVKVQTFLLAAFFAGAAGGLYAHLVQFINPRSFDIIKSTEILVMLYLGGVASLAGSVVGASIYTLLLEALRFLGVWRWVLAPLLLVLLMILRPRGLLGYREFGAFIPARERAYRAAARLHAAAQPDASGAGAGAGVTPAS